MGNAERSWTEADKAKLIQFDNEGQEISTMAEYFGVSNAAIHQMRYRLGLTKQRRLNKLATLEQTVRVTGKGEDGWCAYHVKNLDYVTAGIGSEAGEVLSEYKKIARNDNRVLTSERKERILAEVGDVLWYAMAICIALKANIDDVIDNNQAKLFARMDAGEINERGRPAAE